MALDKGSLQSGIKGLLTDMRIKEENADAFFAQELAGLIDAYVKSAAVEYTEASLTSPSGVVRLVETGPIGKLT